MKLFTPTLLALLLARPGPALPPPSTAEIDRLVEQLGSPSFPEREAATKALEAMGERVLSVLKKAAKDAKDAEVRRRAARLIPEIERRCVLPNAMTVLRRGGPGAAKVEQAFAALLASGDEALQRGAVDAALQLAEREARFIPLLVRATEHKDPDVRAQALLRMSRLWPHTEEAVAALLRARKDADPAVNKAVDLGLVIVHVQSAEQMSSLIANLRDGRPEVRAAAAKRLGNLGYLGKRAIPALVEALKDGAPVVRTCAAQAIVRIDPDAAVRAGVQAKARQSAP